MSARCERSQLGIDAALVGAVDIDVRYDHGKEHDDATNESADKAYSESDHAAILQRCTLHGQPGTKRCRQMRMSMGHEASKGTTGMSEIKKAGDAIKDVKRVRARFGSAADRLLQANAALDAAATKTEATAAECEAEEKEITALLTELGSNFGPDDTAEVAPVKAKSFFAK
jgi:flagellin-like hook-associated protein FlgL